MERINWLIKKRNNIFKNRKPAAHKTLAATLICCCIFICSLAIMSCAKMPSQAVDLSYSLKDEGQRMHEMNIALVAYVFNEKKRMVNEFINKEYSPALIENFKAILPAGVDVKKDLVEIMQAINPKIEDFLCAVNIENSLATSNI